jgi:hypothetical protein
VVTVDMPHLRPEARELAALPAAERLAHLRSDRWIGYGRARLALGELDRLFRQEPGRVRPSNPLIVGPTNNGKTMLAEKFRRTHPARVSDDGDREVVPVLTVRMPAEPTVARFHGAVLAALDAPLGDHGASHRREASASRLLGEVGTRLLIVDELHNILAGTARRQRELLNLLRYLGNELRIPIVCLGTRDAYLAIRTDDQLENRFHPFLLPRWEDDAEFGRLLASFEAMLPLGEPSHLGSPAMRALVVRRSEGTIGEIAALLVQAATAALLAGRERIDAVAIEAADYQPPSLRRRSFERQLH